ncbi:ribonucleoside-diphosphate reductase, adenosylcobalamin-dependent [Bacteroidia bacterium]|nr:ribonucleoside-diphosphate reductase, adenosylcobalamin-dependent [Bacteroidia bacterium]GHT81089.1 ribonucleoside-diphosphate reductase, adenosylcobalamin-dependent [Bacteroidia bacterium]
MEIDLLERETVKKASKLSGEKAEGRSVSVVGIKLPKKTYTHDEVVAAAKAYFGGDEMAADVWVNKYALKDSYGNIYEQTPADMHHRLAREIARIEKKYANPMSEQEIFGLLDHFNYIIPQGGPMTGIGNPYQIASLSNCFVIGTTPPSDSYGSIFRIDEEQVQLMKRRGGVGHDLSHIRPTGSPVLNSALNSTGIVPFMERYSNSTREVAMDGRRGALMISLSVKHPDAERFIDAKLSLDKITGANISIKLDDEFMRCVANGKKYVQQYPIDTAEPKYKYEIDAQALWKKVIHNAWKSGEPGVLFWDTVINNSIPDCYADYGFGTISTNPCGEIPLCAYDSCRLVAINLYGYVDHPFTPQATFNEAKYKEHIGKAMRIMDDIIDLELEKIDAISSKIEADPEPDDIRRVEKNLWKKIREKATLGRRTGLGITAEGDMLAALGLRYGTPKSIDFAVKTQRTLALEAYRASVTMAKERGGFSIYNASLEAHNPMIQRIAAADPALYQEMTTHGRRNIAMLTIAPTGTTSVMSQTTSGIEPAFSLRYTRRRKINPNDRKVEVNFVDKQGDAFEEYAVLHHKFQTWLEAAGYSPAEIEEIKNSSNEQWQSVAAKSPYYSATSEDIDWVNKVRLQGEMQQWVDHSISATVNLPAKVTEDLVERVYQTAWKSGCKGITVYRNGSRDGVLIDRVEPKTPENVAPPKKRPISLDADIIHFKNKSQDWIAFVGLFANKPYEIFTGMLSDIDHDLRLSAKVGKILKVPNEDGTHRYDLQYQDAIGTPQTLPAISGMFNKEFWNYARLISGVLRSGIPLVEVINIIDNMHFEEDGINSWKSGVKRALKKYIPDGTKNTLAKCDSCGSDNLMYQEGCLTCMSCGSSKCG